MALKITKISSASQLNSVNQFFFGPYDSGLVIDQQELSINAVGPALIVVPVFSASRSFVSLRNTSTGGQALRVGIAGDPAFGIPNRGQLLLPGEEIEIYDLATAVLAIADTAGALMSRLIIRSSGIV